MRCLTDTEFSKLLISLGLKLNQDHHLELCNQVDQRYRLLAYVPKDANDLFSFASWLVGSLAGRRDRILWLQHWTTYPPDNIVLFEKLRAGCGEFRPIGEAPGHLFSPVFSSNFDSRTTFEVEEDVVSAALVLFVTKFDWDAYILSEDCADYIYLSDGYVSFSSVDQVRLESFSNQLISFNCDVRWIKAE